MISSMTGYGRGVHTTDETEVSAEIKSVNNRFLDISLKLPRSLAIYEQQIRELVNKFVNRGRLSIWLKSIARCCSKPRVNVSMLYWPNYVKAWWEVTDASGD